MKDFEWYGVEYLQIREVSRLNVVRHFASITKDECSWDYSYSRDSDGRFFKKPSAGESVIVDVVPEIVIRLFELSTREKIERAVDKGKFFLDGVNVVRDL